MSYLVLARKYRSRSFAELVGQEHVVKALTNALTQGRLHHAYLFTGTRGVGKTSVSRILAKSLNCVGPDGQGGVTAEPCGVCHACRDIDAGRFVDYVELDAASNRGVDEITTLLGQAVYKPVVGRFKVYMIDEVHMLSTTAFNAMLKTLEEPPDYLKFVLATTDPQKVPPTVLSRCLQFNLRPMAPQTVQQHLARVLVDEGIAADAGALRLLSRAARGSMRDALSLTDQAIAYGAGRLSESGVREMLGAVDRGHAVRIVEALAAADGAAVVAAADALRELGLSAAGTLDELAELLQQMAVAQAVPDALDAADPEAPTVGRLATLLAADELQLLYSMALHGRAELGLAPDEYSGLVMVLLRMLAFRPGDAPRRAPIDGVKPTIDAAATRPPVAAPSASPFVAAASVAESPPSRDTAAMTPVPREAALRASGSLAARVNVVPAPTPSTGAKPVTDRPPSNAPTRAEAPAVNAQVAMSAPVTTSDAGDFGEPPPWLDVPFDVDQDVAVMSPPVVAPVEAPATATVDRLEQAPAPPAPPAAPAFIATALGDRWAALVDQLSQAGSIGALVRELALQSECLAAGDNGPWRLRVERESLRAPGLVEKLRVAMAGLLGDQVTLDVERGQALDSPAMRNAAERDRRQREAEQLIQEDPRVKSLLSQFRTARIVPGSIKPV